MNQKKAKAIKKKVYGESNPRHRNYTKQVRKDQEGKSVFTGALVADERRAHYQAMKKVFKKGIKF